MINILAAILSYIIGSISPSYIISTRIYKKDIRNYGSGNAGATNALRVLGVKPALVILVLDMLKGMAAVLIGRQVGGEVLSLVCGVMAVIGHNWSLFLRFRGGKGVATSMGVILLVYPLGALIAILTGIVMIAVSRYVSLGSISAAVVFPITVLLASKPFHYIIFSVILSALAIIRHESNIKRLLTGNESKIGQKVK